MGVWFRDPMEAQDERGLRRRGRWEPVEPRWAWGLVDGQSLALPGLMWLLGTIARRRGIVFIAIKPGSCHTSPLLSTS